MGYYIQTNDVKNKAEFLVKNYEASIVSLDQALQAMIDGFGVVCVVDNGLFEAAGYCYSNDEFEAFLPTNTDHRPRQWVVMNKEVAALLSGYRPSSSNC